MGYNSCWCYRFETLTERINVYNDNTDTNKTSPPLLHRRIPPGIPHLFFYHSMSWPGLLFHVLARLAPGTQATQTPHLETRPSGHGPTLDGSHASGGGAVCPLTQASVQPPAAAPAAGTSSHACSCIIITCLLMHHQFITCLRMRHQFIITCLLMRHHHMLVHASSSHAC